MRAAEVERGNLGDEAAKRWSRSRLRARQGQAVDAGRDERSGEPEPERSLATAAVVHRVSSASYEPGRAGREPLECRNYPLRPEGSVLVADVKGHGAGRREHNPMDVSG